MLWPPSSEVRNTKPGLKMKDLQTSYKQKMADGPEVPPKVSSIRQDVLAVLIRENRFISVPEMCAILKRSKTPVRDALNSLLDEKLACSLVINRLKVYEASQWAKSQKADD